MKRKILLVDGYNMIAYWQKTRLFFRNNQLDSARRLLLSQLHNYANFTQLAIICVFDAHLVPGVRMQYDDYQLSVVFTKEDETADAYIERLAVELNTGLNLVEVATSDLNEQWAIFSQGALRVPARELEERVNAVKLDLDKTSQSLHLKKPKLRPFSDKGLLNPDWFTDD